MGHMGMYLLIGNEWKTTDSILPYIFSLILLSNNDSLTYLHLQNCLLVEPMDFSGLKDLRTLVLHLVFVKQKLLQSLCSHCSHLVDLTLDDCQFISSIIEYVNGDRSKIRSFIKMITCIVVLPSLQQKKTAHMSVTFCLHY